MSTDQPPEQGEARRRPLTPSGLLLLVRSALIRGGPAAVIATLDALHAGHVSVDEAIGKLRRYSRL